MPSFNLTSPLWKIACVVLVHWALLMLAALAPDLPISRDLLLRILIAAGLPLDGIAVLWLSRRVDPASSGVPNLDELTGLGDRQTFIGETKELLKHARSGSRALVLVDVDELEALNVSCGQQAGDELLAAAAGRLVAENQYVYRIGGDEFAIVIDRGKGEAVTSCLSLLEPFSLQLATCGHEHRVCFTYGYASNNNHEGFESLYRRAETCLAELRRQLYASGERVDRRSRSPSREELRAESIARANARATGEPPISPDNIASLADRRRERVARPIAGS
jgi:diguanylate cyclase (GGDEF)-like protein